MLTKIKKGIFGLEFNAAKHILIARIRDQLTQVRGMISDFKHEYPGWREHVAPAEGALTCVLITLYNLQQELLSHEIKEKDRIEGPSYRFGVRGIGLDICPGCFVCGSEKRNETSNHYLNNIAAFVDSEAEGKMLVGWFDKGAFLDFRLTEPNWIQVKIGCCDKHLPNLRHLEELTRDQGRIRQVYVKQSIAFQEESLLISDK